LHTGEHASAEARFAAAASQLRGRDKLDREELRGLRRQMRAEKKVRKCYQEMKHAPLPEIELTCARHEVRAVRQITVTTATCEQGALTTIKRGQKHPRPILMSLL